MEFHPTIFKHQIFEEKKLYPTTLTLQKFLKGSMWMILILEPSIVGQVMYVKEIKIITLGFASSTKLLIRLAKWSYKYMFYI